MMRQIAGAFAEYEKARLVGKLRSARQRARNERGRCEGRKTLAEKHPEAVALAKRLHRASPKTGERRSLRVVSAELAKAGCLNSAKHRGATTLRPYSAATIKAMIEGPMPAKRAGAMVAGDEG